MCVHLGGPCWVSVCWGNLLPAQSIPVHFSPQVKPFSSASVFARKFLFIFFPHFLLNSIPTEANFLARSGGSGSGYGGGWDTVQRFKDGSVGSGCLGHWGIQALPERVHCPPLCSSAGARSFLG